MRKVTTFYAANIKTLYYFCIGQIKLHLNIYSMNIERFTTYLSAEKKYSPHTVTAYGGDLAEFKSFLEKNMYSVSDNEIDFQTIRAWVVSLMEKGISPTSVNRKISSLRAYFKHLLRRGEIEKTPMLGQGNLKKPIHVTVPYSTDEMKQVLSAELYENDPDGELHRMMIELFYGCGLRCSELCNTKIKDIDFNSSMLHVYGKGGKERLVPIHATLLTKLKAFTGKHLNMEKYLFEKDGKKMQQTLVYRIINNYLGLVTNKMKKSPHVLRHTFATHLIENGADISSVKELLGHSSLVSTQVYTHTSLGKLKSVYNHAHPHSGTNSRRKDE